MSGQTVGEALGRGVGLLLAPVVAAASRLRGARALHPAGMVCAAEVESVARDEALLPLAKRLAGAAIVRMSGALWKHEGAPELLGCAIRFRGDRPRTPELAPADQDLLFATFRSLWSLLPATLRTRQHDYLHNDYYTVGVYEAPGLGWVELRLVPAQSVASTGGSRDERLAQAMRSGAAELRLELRRARRGAPWQPLCEVRLVGPLAFDEALEFSPFHAGQGLEPRGALHALRLAPYEAGQRARAAVLAGQQAEQLTATP